MGRYAHHGDGYHGRDGRNSTEGFYSASNGDETYSDSDTDTYSSYTDTVYNTSTTDRSSTDSASDRRRRSTEPVQQSIERKSYEVVKTLGKGHFAEVCLARCGSGAGREYFAVKRARRRTSSTLKSFKNEVEILKGLDSPYVIKYLGERADIQTLQLGNRHWNESMVEEIYLEHIEWGTLSDFVRRAFKRGRGLSENRICEYTRQVLKGVNYLHSMGVLHRDLKGSNVLLSNPHVKISDFGLSKYINMPNGNTNRLITRAGTRGWMAPEVVERREQGFPSDIWSFGCIVLQMITGQPPNSSESRHVIQLLGNAVSRSDYSVPLPRSFDGLSSHCIRFLSRCLTIDPVARWTSEQLLEHPFVN